MGSYFRDHLTRARGASPHTLRSYRDTLRLLFSFIADRRHRSVADLKLDAPLGATLTGLVAAAGAQPLTR